MYLINFLAFVLYLSFVIILITKTPKFLPSKIFSLFIFCFMIWSFFSIMFYRSNLSVKNAFFYINLTSIGWIYAGSIYLWFIMSFTKSNRFIKNIYGSMIMFGLPLLFIIAQWNNMMVGVVLTDNGLILVWKSTKWLYCFLSYVLIVNTVASYLGFKIIKSSKELIRIKKMKIIIYGGMFVYLLIVFWELILPFVFKLFNLPNMGSVIGVPWGLITVYALVKYRTLDAIPNILSERIIDTMFDSMILLNANKEIISVNKSVSRVFGYTKEELIGKPLCILQKKHSEHIPIIEQININSEFSNFESVFKNKYGKDVFVVISTSTITNRVGIVEAIVCIIKDISKLKRNEKIKDVLLNISDASRTINNLQELSKMVHKQVGLLTDAENFYIALIDNEAQGTYSFPYIVDVNPEEYVAPDVSITLKHSLTHFVYKTKTPILIKDNVAETVYKKYGIKIVGIDAKSWLGVPLKVSDDKNIGVLVLQSYSNSDIYTMEDLNVLSIISNTIASVIDHWQTDETLIQLEKMEVVGKLAGGVAHDLNNVLGAIVSYPDLILKKLPDDSSLRRTIIKIQQSGLKAAAIVQDLLTLARRGVAINTVVNINEIILDYLESPVFEKLQAYHSNIEIESKLVQDIPYIKGSALHLSKTIMNLVSNAAESIFSEGKIFISTEIELIKEDIQGYYQIIKKGTYIVLKISDTGSGIGKNDLNKIFEPFYTKKTMGRSGTGLGMAVVWGTVQDHKGYIDVHSLEGKGTSFIIYLPVSKKIRIKNKNKISISDYSSNGERVLIIDDLDTQREIATALLTELGYSVFSASSGKEGIEFLKENDVDLCIIDMIMEPGIDGLDTYKEIIRIQPKIKAIIASGFSESLRVKEALKLGVNYYVPKPYTIEKIGMAVRKVLNKDKL